MSGSGAIKLNSFPDPGKRYRLDDVIRIGSFGKTYIAKDTEASNKLVVVKIQEITPQNEKYLKDEYKLLRDISSHANIVDFYGAFCVKNELMLVTEYCEGGNLLKVVNDLLAKNRRMQEEHIVHILKEVIKALSYLHEKHIIHRDIRASNILLTKSGEVKITGFGLCVTLASTFGRSSSAIGSPDWMAPEVIQAKSDSDNAYDNRSDVWSLGITAIELGDGKTPFKDMHPTRILFQVVRNPPPTLYRTTNWSDSFNDFIAECLVKNPEHRPYISELMGHPFIEEIPDKDFHLSTELATLLSFNKSQTIQDVHVMNNVLWEGENRHDEPMYVEDLAALDDVEEQNVVDQIERRFNDKKYQTFVGEILVTLNPNEDEHIYNEEYHARYMMKSKSENVPHIYAVADSAYQNALHHVLPQKIILSGESGSGKTKNFLNIFDHLLFIGNNVNIQMSRFKDAVELIHAFTHASTPYNDFSTRCIMKTDVSYGRTGKVTATSFNVSLLEKTRISSTDMNQANFNIFYFLYDGVKKENLSEDYKMNTAREYRYLRILEEERGERPRVEINKNVAKFKKIKDIMREFEFSSEDRETIFNCLSAILLLGEVRFQESENESAQLANPDVAKKVAQLLDTDERKFCWALTNYCLLKDGTVVSKKNTCDEARDTRDVLANNMYTRLVDFVVSQLNHKLAFGKAVFGEKYLIHILDYCGFECFKMNELWQLFINIFNEQMQHYYIQRIFKWEIVDLTDDNIEYEAINYYNNQKLLDTLLGKSDGILNIIGQASKLEHSGKYITEYISNMDSPHLATAKNMEFSVNHYTGKLNYNAKEMPDKNRDFLPPEIVETMRSSNNPIIKLLFSAKLNKTGNLIIEMDDEQPIKPTKFMEALKKGPNGNKFSQSKKLRTLATIFKSVCLDTLTDLSSGSTSGGTHFVRCIKTNLKAKPNNFCRDLVKQQLRAMAIPQTAKMRKEGYAFRIQFAEFLRRYQFLAFDFDENVDITPENCRLLLIRLKMEGWVIGKKRVFLKYYNEEYLSRLYESKVKKIIKIQSILRGFLTKCRMKKNMIKQGGGNENALPDDYKYSEEEAAQVIQKAYRRKGKKESTEQFVPTMKNDELKFIRPYAMRWKKGSFIQLLLKMKAKKIFDTFNFSMQAFIYNQKAFVDLKCTRGAIKLLDIDRNVTRPPWSGKPQPIIMKLNYRWNEIPFYNTSDMRPDKTSIRLTEENIESWDKPYRWRNQLSIDNRIEENLKGTDETFTTHPFIRNPDEKLRVMDEKYPKPIRSPSPKIVKSPMKDQKQFKNTKNEIAYKQYASPKKEVTPIKLRTVEPRKHYTSDNTTSANKDFDYIKAPVLNKVKGPDPIAELKSMGRKNSASEDNPPFNFQGMLRKTNFKRDSMKTIVNARRFSLKSQEKDESMTNGVTDKTQHISFELGPELLLEGTVYDL